MQLTIDPAEVRLRPKRDDLYRWRVPVHKEHLFQQSLSKLSTGVYTQIVDGIGKQFEAISSDNIEEMQQPTSIAVLQEELSLWRDRAKCEHESKTELETELARARDRFSDLEQKYAQLESRYKESTTVVLKLRTRMDAYCKGYAQIEQIMFRAKHFSRE